MSLRGVNILLLCALIASFGLSFSAKPDASQPNREFLPDMVHSIPYDAFSPNPNFADGKTLQTPVPGTIPRGTLPLQYAPTPEDALRAGQELANPFSLEEQPFVERGARMYATFCVPCHGVSGKGDGLVALRGFPPPASLMEEKAVGMEDGQMFHVLSFGQGNMPSYASQLSREDRWKTILYVRLLQQQSAQEAAAAAQTLEAQILEPETLEEESR